MTRGSVQTAVAQFQRGGFVIVVDDEERENEGDLCVAAELVTPEQVSFMMNSARGLIGVGMEGARLDALRLPPMLERSNAHFRTDFAISVDARGSSTGVSAADRALTIRTLADPSAKPSDLVRPGHVFPFRARPGGVLVRAGHTEAAVDLARMAGLQPAGVLCEIANQDGTMARRPELERLGRRHRIPIVTVEDLIAQRRRQETLFERGPETSIPTAIGRWHVIGFTDRLTGAVHVALFLGELPLPEPVLVRVHSECLTGDVFGSQRCDCQAQLHQAMEQIAKEGTGLVVYLRQEGRGIGLMAKLRAYALQDQGQDTVEANLSQGLPADSRDYQVGSQIIADLGVHKMRVMSNNPRKYHGLQGHGLEIVERVPLLTEPTHFNARYLATKQAKMGHLLGVPEAGQP